MKAWILAGLIIVLLLSGCTELGIGVKDCGADKTCFREALHKCEPAKYEMEFMFLVRLQILGLEKQGCKIHNELLNPSTRNKVEEYNCIVENYQTATFGGVQVDGCKNGN